MVEQENHIDPARPITAESVRTLLRQVMDPEIPVLTIADLGILRDIRVHQPPSVESAASSQSVSSQSVSSQSASTQSASPQSASPDIEIVLTPTYSGCPAMDLIRSQVLKVLADAGLHNARITTVLSPAWTTDWITPHGRDQLEAYGIAPPNPVQQFCTAGLFRQPEAVRCPLCQSWHTTQISEFGSTPCKALYRCEDCKEPFDHFKCH